MPIYEYECQSCGETLEKLQKMSAPPLTDCPKCGKASLSKLVSAPGFRLKGSGWYETDFKDKKAKPANTDATPAKAASKTDTASKTSSDSKKSD